MRDWKHIFPAMKPERILVAHMLFWMAFITFAQDLLHDTGRKVVMIFLFFLFYGGIYIFNDIADIKDDKEDKHNKGRLIAAGKLSFGSAVTASVLAITGAMYYATLFFGSVLTTELYLLLIINGLYSIVIKKIPYLDVFWISSTQWIKFLVAATILRDGLSLDWSIYGPLMIAFWLGSVSMHLEKQRGRLLQGRKRTFLFGRYDETALVWLQRLSYSLVFVLCLVYWQQHLLYSVLFCMGALVWVSRLLFPNLTREGFVETMEERFKPR